MGSLGTRLTYSREDYSGHPLTWGLEDHGAVTPVLVENFLLAW